MLSCLLLLQGEEGFVCREGVQFASLEQQEDVVVLSFVELSPASRMLSSIGYVQRMVTVGQPDGQWWLRNASRWRSGLPRI